MLLKKYFTKSLNIYLFACKILVIDFMFLTKHELITRESSVTHKTNLNLFRVFRVCGTITKF